MDVESLEQIRDFIKTIELSSPIREKLLDEITKSIFECLRQDAISNWIKKEWEKNHPELPYTLRNSSLKYPVTDPPVLPKTPGSAEKFKS